MRHAGSVEFVDRLSYPPAVGWAVRMGTAMVGFALATATGLRADPPIEVEAVRLERGPDHVRIFVSTTTGFEPAVRSVRGEGGVLQRVYLDFPPGTRVRPGVPRNVVGAGLVRRVALGLTADQRVRLLVDLEGDPVIRVRRSPAGRGLAIVVAAHPGAEPRARPRLHGGRPIRIVIDPGHGGDDPGASGALQEKVVTLAIATEVAVLLRSRLGAEVHLTRDDDTAVSLSRRTRLANAARADVLVSIHANASAKRATRGVETYYLDNTADHATLRLASIENGGNAPPLEGGTSLDYILSSLVQGGKQQASRELAGRIQASIVGRLRRDWTRVTDLGVKRGPFYVLVGAYMPSVLVETSFLSHPEEGRRLADAAYRRAIAEGVTEGIAAFLATRAQAGTL